MSETDFPVVTICGSMRYHGEMMEAAKSLTQSGYIVLMPFVADYIGARKADALKVMLDEMHLAKIDLSTIIVVVGEHIGESTAREIEHATQNGVTVTYWNAQIELPMRAKK